MFGKNLQPNKTFGRKPSVPLPSASSFSQDLENILNPSMLASSTDDTSKPPVGLSVNGRKKRAQTENQDEKVYKSRLHDGQSKTGSVPNAKKTIFSLLKAGEKPHVDHLCTIADRFDTGGCSHSLKIAALSCWSSDSATKFKKWVLQLGFKENSNGVFEWIHEIDRLLEAVRDLQTGSLQQAENSSAFVRNAAVRNRSASQAELSRFSADYDSRSISRDRSNTNPILPSQQVLSSNSGYSIKSELTIDIKAAWKQRPPSACDSCSESSSPFPFTPSCRSITDGGPLSIQSQLGRDSVNSPSMHLATMMKEKMNVGSEEAQIPVNLNKLDCISNNSKQRRATTQYNDLGTIPSGSDLELSPMQDTGVEEVSQLNKRSLRESRDLKPEQASSFTFLTNENISNGVMDSLDSYVCEKELSADSLLDHGMVDLQDRPDSKLSDSLTVIDDELEVLGEKDSSERGTSNAILPSLGIPPIDPAPVSDGTVTPVLSPKANKAASFASLAEGTLPLPVPPRVTSMFKDDSPAFLAVPRTKPGLHHNDMLDAFVSRRPNVKDGLKSHATVPNHVTHSNYEGAMPFSSPICPQMLPAALRLPAHDDSFFTPQTKQLDESWPWLESNSALPDDLSYLEKCRQEAHERQIPEHICLDRSRSAPGVLELTRNIHHSITSGRPSQPIDSLGSQLDQLSRKHFEHHRLSDPVPLKSVESLRLPIDQCDSNAFSTLKALKPTCLRDDRAFRLSASPCLSDPTDDVLNGLSNRKLSLSKPSTPCETLFNKSPKSSKKKELDKRARLRRRSSMSTLKTLPLPGCDFIRTRKMESMAFLTKKQLCVGHDMDVEDFSNISIASDCDIDPNLVVENYSPELFRRFAVVVGGHCTYTFDNLSPVVAFHMEDEYVCDLRLVDELELCIFNKKKGKKWIKLGSEWRYMPASPMGYLVVAKQPDWTSTVTFYYLHKSPRRWQAFNSRCNNPHHHLNECVDMIDDSRINMNYDESANSSDQPDNSINSSFDLHMPGILRLSSRNSLDMDFALSGDDLSSKMHPMMDVDFMGDPTSPFSPIHNHAMTSIPEESFGDQSLNGCIGQESEAVCDIWSVSTFLYSFMQFLTCEDLRQGCLLVNKLWSLSAHRTLYSRMNKRIWSAGINGNLRSKGKGRGKKSVDSSSWDKYESFIKAYPCGIYLTSGACKEVFCVRKEGGGSLSAVSVMNITDLVERDMQECVLQELDISLLCSSLLAMRICPNMIRIYQTFRSTFNVHQEYWSGEKSTNFPNQASANLRLQGLISNLAHSSANNVNTQVAKLFESSNLRSPSWPSKMNFKSLKSSNPSDYQFIHMEYCLGGDMETYWRKVQLDDTMICSYMFQMCYALFVARDCFALRHYDIKLLNFFLTSANDLLTDKAVDNVLIGLGPNIYSLPVHHNCTNSSTASIVKLADFGTSALGPELIGKPITVQQFTTIENAAPEMFLLGSSARQSFALDAFPLGLCFLHLFLSNAPYEEVLSKVRCPLYLYGQLLSVYHTNDRNNPYFVIREVVSSLCEDDTWDCLTHAKLFAKAAENVDDCPYTVVMDTIYRFLVLMNHCLPESFVKNEMYKDNPVHKVVVDALGLGGGPQTIQPTRAVSSRCPGSLNTREYCIQTYRNDTKAWSLASGDNQLMIRMRKHLEEMGASELVSSLLDFDPSSRYPMLDALQHPMFDRLRLSSSDGPHRSVNTASFMHYYRPSEELPPL